MLYPRRISACSSTTSTSSDGRARVPSPSETALPACARRAAAFWPSTLDPRRSPCDPIFTQFCPTPKRRRLEFVERPPFGVGQKQGILSPKIVFVKTGQNVQPSRSAADRLSTSCRLLTSGPTFLVSGLTELETTWFPARISRCPALALQLRCNPPWPSCCRPTPHGRS